MAGRKIADLHGGALISHGHCEGLPSDTPNRPAAFPAWPLWQTATPPTPSTVAWPLGRSGMAVNGSRGQIGPFGDVSALSGRFAAVLHQFLPPTKKQNQCRVGLPEALMQVNEEYQGPPS